MYFIANWKMFGSLKSLKSLNKVIKFSKFNKNNKFKLIYCPPYTLLNLFFKKFINSEIDIGGQNCHHVDIDGPYTGSINSKMLKNLGAKYVILGHSENRMNGESNSLINKKIKSSIKNGLKVIFCIGETLAQKKKKLTNRILVNQIVNALKGVKKKNCILFAYEPVWSIGTGKIPTKEDLENSINFIKIKLKKKYKLKNPKVIYGGSVNAKNITYLNKINSIDGFLVGLASQKAKNFIDIIKKTFN